MKLQVVKGPTPIPGVEFPDTLDIPFDETRQEARVGRFKENDIVIPDLRVSRRHARLSLESDRLFVRDLGSKYGTFVNKQRLPPQKKVVVKPGDLLQFGSVTLTLVEAIPFYAYAADSALDAENISAPVAIAPAVEADVVRDESAEVFVDELLASFALMEDTAITHAGTPERVPDAATVVEMSAPAVLEPDVAVAELPSTADFLENEPEIASETSLSIPDSDGNAADTRTNFIWRALSADPVWLPWVYLLLISIAEYVTAAVNVQVGQLIHAFILVGVVVQGALARDTASRNLLLSLSVAPLIRILSLSLPLIQLPQLVWYPLVAIPLLVATLLIARQLGLSTQSMGLSVGKHGLALQLMLAGGGLGLGVIEFTILRPKGLVSSLSVQSLLFPILSLVIFTGFNEEVIFRGLLQATAVPSLRRWALIYVSLLFAALHIGYLSLSDVIFVFVVGLAFAYIVQLGGSILGVTLAHGLTNVTLFLLAPYLADNPSDPIAGYGSVIVAVGVAGAFLSLGIMLWRTNKKRHLVAAIV